MYYQQIRDITNTLQKELQTKEELASELRDAYEKLRNNAKAFDDLQIYDFFMTSLWLSYFHNKLSSYTLYNSLYCAVDFVDDLDGLSISWSAFDLRTFLLCAGVHASDGWYWSVER